MKAADKRGRAREPASASPAAGRGTTGPLGAGFSIANAELLCEQYPATFEIPTLEERLNLSPGDLAKLILMPGFEHCMPERMWLRVVSCIHPVGNVTFYRGTLANEPTQHETGLRFGACVSFTSRQIIAAARGTGAALREGANDAAA